MNDSPLAALRTAADGLLSVLLAPCCASCGAPLDEPTRGPICEPCWASIVPFTPPLCTRCGDPLPTWRTISLAANACPRCRRRSSPISVCRAIGSYEGSLRSIVHAFKYGGRRTLARRLAARMRARNDDILAGVDVVVPVPLHRSRRRFRGFNQAEELARHLSLPMMRSLKRIRATPSQTDLPAGRRHANVRGAFSLARACSVRGLCVVLVDDVCTTGATLESCGRALIDAGAREVRAITAARVVSRARG
jgi:ComF family protein